MSELLVTSIYNQEGEGAPSFPKGATSTGVITATSFSGSGANLTGIDATALKDGSGNVKIQANSDGAVVTGVLTATTGSFTGNVSVGGTLTYEDVTNIDAVGLITARSGIKVTGGDIDLTSGNIKVGTATTIDNSGINVTGVVTATSFVGNGANLTNLPPAGNTFTGIASGSIANNKAVMVCQDGKLAEISSVDSPATSYASAHGSWMGGGEIRSPQTVWNPRDNMVYATYTNTSGQLYVQRYSGNTGSGDLTDNGNDGAIATSVNTGNESRVAMCYDTAKNQLFASYNRTDGTNGWKYRIGTPNSTNNTGLDWGNQVAPFNYIYYADVCYEPTQGKIVLLYRDDNNGDDLYIIAGQISDSTSSATITWGSAVRVDGTNNIAGNSRLSICSCGNSRVLFSWSRTSNDTRCGAATITAGNGVTDISASFPQLTGNGAYSNVAWDHSKDKGVVTYRDANTSDYGMGRLVTLGASNACTVGSQVAFKTGSYERGWSTYNAKIQTILMQYQSGGGSGATNFIQANISGSTLTWVNNGTYNNGTDSYGQHIASWNAADFSQSGSYGYVSMNKTRASNNNGVMYTAIVVSSVSTLKNQSQYVGFAAQAYTNGQTATINTYGNNVSTLSGLTTSSLYYVQGDGTIGLSADSTLSGYFVSGTPVAGTALNGTTLLIRDPATRV